MAKPEIRLKGYEGEWEIKQLNKLGFMTAGGTPSTFNSDYWNGTINWLQSGAIQNNIIYPDSVIKKITEEGLKNSSTYLIKKDSVLIAITGATCANIGYLSFPSCANQSVVSLEPNSSVHPMFVFQNLLTIRDKILAYKGGSAQSGVSLNNLKKVELCLPVVFEEQVSIADYFMALDTMKQATEKKIESLKQIKSACLVSMFPQAGETTPRVRFKGFEGEWDYLPMSDIFMERHDISTITESLPQLSFTIEEGVIRPEDRKTNKRDFLIKDKSNKKYLVTRLDDIIYNPANVIYGAIHKNSLCDGVVSPIYKIFYTQQDPSFMECVVRRPEFIKEMTIYMEGTVQKLRTLKPEAFLRMSAYIAPSLEEQKKIGNYFRSLDKQISLQEKRLEKLKQIKAACLDKMFV